MKRTTHVLAGIGLVLVGALAGQWVHDSGPTAAQSKALKTLRSAYEVVRTSYVEPVPPDTLVSSSLEGMVQSLDPFSMYISPRRMRQVQETFRGSFEGIGISYELIDGPSEQDTIEVMAVVPGGPSAKAGLRAGDRIVRVGTTSAVGWSHRKIQQRLKGPRGSTVEVTLRRPTAPDLLRTTITRDQVPLETVQARYMLDEQTGYLRLGRFAEPTEREVSQALRALKDEGMSRLMLDLRGNAGGLMRMAEAVADEFLVEGQVIVTARSRHDNYEGRRVATAEGQWQEGPLIVLVDEQSASASEIVAGAVQDHDRAVLVGRRTFGKGLIQRQFDLGDDSGVRLTVARFYTPSGRLLQRAHGDRDALRRPPDTLSAVPDSLIYRSDAGRALIGGGGIVPDRVVDPEPPASYRQAVQEAGVLRSFARRWIDAHAAALRSTWEDRPEAFAEQFALPETVYPAFVRYAAEQGVRPPAGPPPAEGGAPTDGAVRAEIEAVIRGYVGQRLFGTSMRLRIQNQTDPVVQDARTAWPRAAEWAARYPVNEGSSRP
jgi:carboxyl-terminal processing protease